MHADYSVQLSDWGYQHAGRTDWVARHLSLTIPAGQHVLLLGASGIGKSTILEAMAGLLGSSSSDQDEDGGLSEGHLLVGGIPADQARGRVALMLQDPFSQAVLQRVGDNVAFGLENRGVPREHIWPRVKESLSQVGLGDLELNRQTAHLSGGQMQRLALAGALCMKPGVLLLDEPTANLDPDGAQQVVHAVHDVTRSHPTTLMVVEHHAELWLDMIDRVIILAHEEGSNGTHGTNNGKNGGSDECSRDEGSCDDASYRTIILADGTPDDVFSSDLDFDDLGIWVPQKYVAGRAQRQRERARLMSFDDDSSSSDSPVVLSTKDLAIGHSHTPIAEHIDARFQSGQITALVGQNGAGKSTFALTLAGLLNQKAGHVVASQQLRSGLASADPHDWSSPQLARRVSYVFQDPEHQFVTSHVIDEVEVGLRIALKQRGTEDTAVSDDAISNDAISDDAITAQAERLLNQFGLSRYRDVNPYTLSGGEKRRLTVAAALAAAPHVLLLDEPTFGQDRRTWLEMVHFIRRVAHRGVCVIVVTHDRELVTTLADHVLHVGTDQRADIRTSPVQQRAEKPRPASVSRVLACMNPAVRLLSALAIGFPMVLSLDVVSAAVFCALCLLLLLILGFRPCFIARHTWPILVAVPWSFLAVLLYGKIGGAIFLQWGPIHISERSIWLASATVFRILGSTLPAVLFLLGTDTTDLADALSQVLHLPDKFVYGGLVGTRMISVLQSDWQALSQARRSRGLGQRNRFRRFFPQAFAFLVLSIRRSTQVATAMQARGFDFDTPRSHARLSRASRTDWLFLALCCAIPIIALIVSACVGTFAFLGGK